MASPQLRILVLVLGGLAGASPAGAQQAATFAVRSLTPEAALRAAQGALQSCARTGYQVAVDLGDTTVLGVAQRSHQGDDVQAAFMLRQGIAPLGLRAIGAVVGSTVGVAAAADRRSRPRRWPGS